MPAVDSNTPELNPEVAADTTAVQIENNGTSTQETATEQQAAADASAAQTASAPALPQYPRAYRILFGWNEARLDSSAFDTLRQAANNARNGGVTLIEATGHADTSGTNAFNDDISKRRAEAVQHTLMSLGIPADMIDIHWKGERELLVETGDGIREPQNRRVEILFSDN